MRTRSLRVPSLAAVFLGLLAACAPAPVESLPKVRGLLDVPVDLDGSRPFLDLPFPSNVDVRANGTRVVQGFPNPTLSNVLEDYRGELSKGRGWSLNGALFLPFESALDPAALPTPAQSVLPDSPVQLLDIDPASPERGTRIPIRLRFDAAMTSFLPGNVLVALPVLGFPMRPATTYALVVKGGSWATPGKDLVPSADHAALLVDGAPADSRLTAGWQAYALLRKALTDFKLGPMAHGTVFTTANPMPELAAARDVVLAGAPYPTSGWTKTNETNGYTVLEGTISLPQFPRGTAPWEAYDGVSGSFQAGPDGKPMVQRMEDVRFAMTVPKKAAPQGGWPLVLVAHGTGGDYRSFIGTGAGDESTWLAEANCIAFSISQPIHRTRAGYKEGLEELNTFNFLNPNGAKGVWRQSVLENVALLHSLQNMVPPSALTDGVPLPLNVSHRLYFGHSQGGISGAMSVGVETDLDVGIFSGAGGGFAESLLEKTEPVVIADAVRLVLGLDASEPLDEFHPVLALVQLMAEELEPLNSMRMAYAPGRKHPHLLIFSGQTDLHTPPRTHAPLASAAGIPLLLPVLTPQPALELRGLAPVSSPVSNNRVAEGGNATAVLAQFPGDHFAIYRDRAASSLATYFLQSYLADGVPTASR